MSVELENINGGTSGSGGGGDGKFPTIVTDSGSSLPATTGYQVGDTFLDTTDKKIYKAGAGYIKNTSSDYDITIDVDFNTGIGSGFAYGKSCQKNIGGGIWAGARSYYVKFKYTVEEETPIFHLYSYGYSFYANFFILDKKIYYAYYKSSSKKSVSQILTTSINPNTDYIFKVEKISGNDTCYVKLYNSDNVLIEETSFDGTDIGSYNSYDQFVIGSSHYAKEGESSQWHYGTNLFVSLAESAYNFVVYDSNLNWDNGTSLTDKTEYADKTNGILYLYENDELVKIGGSLTKKVYTISADNTSTLDVSSDFTKVVDVLKNGVELAITDDYTISSGVITFVTALSTTDKITVKGE